MSKYEVLPEQLLHEGTITDANIFRPEKIERDLVLLTHTAEYVRRLETLSLSPAEVRRTGFPLSHAVVDREFHIVNGTVACARYALVNGIAMNIAGGTHHAFTDRGAGFCLLNDMAVAANILLAEGSVRQVLIVDLDVHQGDGTAEIFAGNPNVFTFSMHGEKNYPLEKQMSDLDIPLPDFTGDDVYLHTLEESLKMLIDRVQPDFVFYQAGVDILETDQLGRLSVSREGCRRRDRIVLTAARNNRIPITVSMGGGYSREFRDIIEAHANTFRVAQEIFG